MPKVAGYGWITDRDAEILRLRKIEDALNIGTYSIGYTQKDVKQWKSQDVYMGYGTWRGTYEYVDKPIHVGSGYSYEEAKKYVEGGSNRWMIRN